MQDLAFLSNGFMDCAKSVPLYTLFFSTRIYFIRISSLKLKLKIFDYRCTCKT